jgi:hypothetical protein
MHANGLHRSLTSDLVQTLHLLITSTLTSRRLPTAAARVRVQVRSWGRFSPRTSVSLANSHSTDCSTLIIIYQLVADVPSGLSLTRPQETKKHLPWRSSLDGEIWASYLFNQKLVLWSPIFSVGTRGCLLSWDNILQAGMSRVQFLMRSLDF